MTAYLFFAYFLLPFHFSGSIEAIEKNHQVTEIRIEIPQIQFPPLTLLDTVPIYFESSAPMGGFDLKIESSSNAFFSIIDIIPGEFTDSCKWELFSARSSKISDAKNNLIKVWKIVSLPEMIPDDVSPICRQLNHKSVLCRLILLVKKQESVIADLGEISFYWESCRDNVVSSESGKKLYISKKVIDTSGKEIKTDPNFAGRNGPPENCISKRSKDKLFRTVTFINGSLSRAIIDSSFFEADTLSSKN